VCWINRLELSKRYRLRGLLFLFGCGHLVFVIYKCDNPRLVLRHEHLCFTAKLALIDGESHDAMTIGIKNTGWYKRVKV